MKLIAVLFLVLLAGCSAHVKKSAEEPLALYSDTRGAIVLNITGTERVQNNAEWGVLRNVWMNAMQRQAVAAGMQYSEQVGETRLTQAPAILVRINVTNFRYLTTSERVNLGVMVGNAWVNSEVQYLDGQTGKLMGSRNYDTSSSAWEGILSAMTDKQLEALSQAIVADVRGASVLARSHPVAHSPSKAAEQASLEEKLAELQQRNLPYEQYQQEYRRIVEGGE
ncbi:DUF4410 domain-containing protein [Pseudomonas nitroreducens]|uniref:DUF4410 domain-containing protein n=1 Tax=Pseudomonas nitroreducens TaxID=46680 RepID=UPI0002EE5263|nr:DUF4410 domain-containing protein [Pseudomonas nitroreducens]